jgi:hypothetical protein
MIFVPVVTPPPTPPSPRTRELAGLLTKVLEEYTKAHPSTTRTEIRAAFSMAVRNAGPGGSGTATTVAVMVGLVLALTLGGLVFFEAQGGTARETGLPMVVLAMILFVGILLVMVKLRSR